MRSSRWFIIGIVLFLLIMFVVESHLPKKFVWNPTFAQHDHQPLGCAVFDDVLKSSLPDGYSLSRKTFYQFAADSDSCRSILSLLNMSIWWRRISMLCSIWPKGETRY